MSKYAIMIANGCEEVEALTVVDLLRRAGIELDMVNIHDKNEVTSSHNITFQTDVMLSGVEATDYEGIILPGGLMGTNNLKANEKVLKLLTALDSKGRLVAAICAAPTVLGEAGVLVGKKATCYPGCEKDLTGAVYYDEKVVVDGNTITSRGVGTAIPFALELIAYIIGKDKADEIAKGIVYQG
ncbi:MAG: DJ-1/PfpI family protein [Lachnospiraceae bacterium]|nr:DJ-1/PfpI family protein [Lachnospiraceae bacterium]